MPLGIVLLSWKVSPGRRVISVLLSETLSGMLPTVTTQLACKPSAKVQVIVALPTDSAWISPVALWMDTTCSLSEA